jgi:GT2 family glycosyltransferase
MPARQSAVIKVMTSTAAIINWNSGHRLRTCIESLLANTTTVEILVVDNASNDASLDSVQGFRSRVNFVRNPVNRGFAAAVNQAFRATSTPYVLILNPDVRATSRAVQFLEDFLLMHPRAAAIGGHVGDKYLPKALPTVGSLVRENLGFPAAAVREAQARQRAASRREAQARQRAASRIDRRQSDTLPLQVDQPAAAALMIRRDAFEDVGGFDEQFYPAWYEDVDFCQRLKSKGWHTYFAPSAEFLHEGGYSAETMGSPDFLRSYYSNQLRYVKKHFSVLGTAAVRASIAAGMLGRIIGKPQDAAAYGKTLIGALKGW